MAFTAFGALKPYQKRAWRREVMRHARQNMLLNRYIGDDENSVIQRVSELRKTDKGTDAAMIQLVLDLQKDGVAGDSTLKGREEAMDAAWHETQMDQLRHAVTNKGRMDDQRSVIDFRKTAKNNLGFWSADRLEQMFFLTASGIPYARKLNGALRSGSELPNLRFASSATAPTPNRHRRISGNTIAAGDTAAITSTDKLNYDALVDLKAYYEETYFRPIRKGGKEYFLLMTSPTGYAQISKDPKIQSAIVHAMPRSEDNAFFTGAVVTVHGWVIATHRYCYNTLGLTAGNKWGATGNVDGIRSLILGPQALTFVDIEQDNWVEEHDDYENRLGIASGMITGIGKPAFKNPYFDMAIEDFAVGVLDHAR